MLTVDDYIRIRQLILVEGLSRREVARRLGHSRRSIKKALEHSIPPGYRRIKPVRRPALDRVTGIIDAWLDEDRTRPPKQRHTGQRIFDRLKNEHGFIGSVSTVRRYVAHIHSTSGEVYFPLVFDPGEEAQVDWGEAWMVLNGVQTKVFLFCVRLCHSTASFVRAYRKSDQVSLLDGMVRAFTLFGGVPRRCAFDNMKSAVISVGKGRDRTLTTRFKELISHFLFEPRFCNVASGNEKGHVENLVKFSQRTFMTPLPECTDLDALNEHLAAACETDLDRAVRNRQKRTRRELLDEERAALLPLPEQLFDACERRSTRSSKQALVSFDTNHYSVPVKWAHHPVLIKAFVERVELYVEGQCVATHERTYDSGEFVLDPYHYLSLLERKPGGIHNGRPFKGEPWGASFTRLRHELEFRYQGEGTRKFINVLVLFNSHSERDVKQAVEVCLRRGAFSDEAVESVLTFIEPRRSPSLDLSDRPEFALTSTGTRPAETYDVLLKMEVPL